MNRGTLPFLDIFVSWYIVEAVAEPPGKAEERGALMPLARVTELSATSEQSFEDAINQAINRATSTLRNVEAAHVKDMNVLIENGNIRGYKVNLEIVFVLEEGEQP
jgi:dodecin